MKKISDVEHVTGMSGAELLLAEEYATLNAAVWLAAKRDGQLKGDPTGEEIHDARMFATGFLAGVIAEFRSLYNSIESCIEQELHVEERAMRTHRKLTIDWMRHWNGRTKNGLEVS